MHLGELPSLFRFFVVLAGLQNDRNMQQLRQTVRHSSGFWRVRKSLGLLLLAIVFGQ
jgi:hypothetical protein